MTMPMTESETERPSYGEAVAKGARRKRPIKCEAEPNNDSY